MALIDGGGVDPPGGRTQFPLVRQPTDFPGRKHVLENVSDAHRAIIERLQPYNPWKGLDFHPLGLLRDLTDDDKHRLVVATPVTAGGLESRSGIGARTATSWAASVAVLSRVILWR
jgi:hypothetical protein